MLNMTKNGKVFKVPTTMETYYKRLGFSLIEEVEEVEADVETGNGEDDADDWGDVDEYIDKPISAWTDAELKDFAEINEIDLTGAKDIAAIRELVKAHLED